MIRYKQYSKEYLQNLIDTSSSKKEVMIKLGYKPTSHRLAEIFDQMVSEFKLTNLHFRSTKFNNLIGKEYGKLIVLSEDAEHNQQRGVKKKWICKCTCGNIISVWGNNLVSGITNSCGCGVFSKGELKIKNFLEKNKINFETQKKFKELYNLTKKDLRFDFYLPDNNILIEYQGQQHYHPVELFGGEDSFKRQQLYDSYKRDFCKKYHIILIEISYEEFNQIDVILNKILERNDLYGT